MKGYFQKISNHAVSAPLKGYKNSGGCYQCGLYKKCNSPQMSIGGHGKESILVVGEAPGKHEDHRDTQFVGDSGDYLYSILLDHGIKLKRDCWTTNAINCRPTTKNGKNRKPTTKEINCCRYRLKLSIQNLKPKKIILLGSTAVSSFIGDRMNDIGTMERWVGWKIPDQTYQTWVYPTYHPSYLIRNEKNEILHKYFNWHIKNAIEHDEEFKQDKRILKLITDEEKILKYLDSLIKHPPEKLALDYEASGLKPYAKGHYIKTVAFATNSYSAVAFPYLKTNKFKKKLIKILTGPSKKIMQNMAFEMAWTEQIIGCEINNVAFDTMAASHVIDNRTGITGLKFQTYINYGVPDYSTDVQQYLKSEGKGANKFNNIDKAPLRPLLEYNGLDSMYTYRLSLDQENVLSEDDLDDAYDLFHDGIIACYNASKEGINIDEKYFKQVMLDLDDKLKQIDKNIRKSKEHKKWLKFSDNEPLDILSSDQIKKLVTIVLKIKTGKKTTKGNISVDKEVLQKLSKKHTFFKLILAYRKFYKIRGTYVQGLLREAINGHIHPNINLHIARTYRSSVDSPNLQNIPKRDEEMKKLIRLGIKPKKGFKLMAVDYKGAEICSGCIYHGDQQMIAYQIEGKGDMHKEYAAKLYNIPLKEVNDDIKYEGKNGFIFPQFYGDYYGNNAKQLWPASLKLKRPNGITLREHLKNIGLSTPLKYEEHVQEIERQFWEETFWQFNQWKDEAWEEYNELGYVEMYTGFKCRGIMDRKHVVNYRFQGTAFHWLLWAMIEVDYKLRKNNFKSRSIMQIHDELLLNIHPPEEKKVYKLIKKIMTEEIRNYWEWINIPLEVDAKISDVDGNWYEMVKIN